MEYIKILYLFLFIAVNLRIAYQDFQTKKIKNYLLLFLIFLLPFFIWYNINHYNLLFLIDLILLTALLLISYKYNFLPAWDVKYIFILFLFTLNKGLYFLLFISFLILIKISFDFIKYLYYYKNSKTIKPFFKKTFWYKNIKKYIFIILSMKILQFLAWNYLPDFLRLSYINFIIIGILFIVLKYFSKIIEMYYSAIIIFLLSSNTYLIYNWYISLWLLDFLYYMIFIVLFSFLFGNYNKMIQYNDEKIINISDLKEWDHVDREFLIKIFWKYKSINKYLKEKNIIKWKWFYKNFRNPINKNVKNKITNIYNAVNLRNKWTKYSYIDTIKVFNNFSFWPYIFLAFILYTLFIEFF